MNNNTNSKPKKTLLVTGASGFLGSFMMEYPSKEWDIIGTYNNNPVHYPDRKTIQLDITIAKKVNNVLEAIQPDAIFHFAAFSNPNYCEEHPEKSFKVNVEAAKKMAAYSATRQIPYLFTSTDLVFSGLHPPYKVEDTPDPIMVYGKHKVSAEQLILTTYPQAIIARMPVMYGFSKTAQNFLSNWVKSLKQGKDINAFTDEYRTVVHASCAVKGLMLLLENKVSGIWHLGGKERMSRFEFAVGIAEYFKLPKEKIKSALQKDIVMAAQRPPDVSLDSSASFDLVYNPKKLRDVYKK